MRINDIIRDAEEWIPKLVPEDAYKLTLIQEKVNTRRNQLTLVPIGDIHFGHPASDYGMLIDVLRKLKKMNKNDYRIVLMGDLWEGATKYSINNPFESTHSPQEQYEVIKETFRPFKEQILGAIVGNHEIFAYRVTGYEKTKDFCEAIDVPYLRYSGLIKLRLNNIDYDIYLTHGSSGSRLLGTKLNALSRLNTIANADIYLMGHTHSLITANDMNYIRKGNEIIETPRYYVNTGSFFRHSGTYADSKNLAPCKLGVAEIKLGTKEKRINVEI